MQPRIVIAACAAALVTGCMTDARQSQQAQAGHSAQSGRQCFRAAQVNDFQGLDNDTVHVTAGARDFYELELAGSCPDIDWSQRIGIRATGGSSWVCRGFDAELLVPGPMGLDRCPVRSVRRISPEEARMARERRRN